MRNTIHTPLQVHEPRTLGEVRLQADMLRGQVLAAMIGRCRNLFRGAGRNGRARRAMAGRNIQVLGRRPAMRPPQRSYPSPRRERLCGP